MTALFDEHIDAICAGWRGKRGMDDGGSESCRELAPMDAAKIHETAERILAERQAMRSRYICVFI